MLGLEPAIAALSFEKAGIVLTEVHKIMGHRL